MGLLRSLFGLPRVGRGRSGRRGDEPGAAVDHFLQFVRMVETDSAVWSVICFLK